MLEAKDIREGDKLSWEGSCDTVYGYVVERDGGKWVMLEDGHCFRLADLLLASSLKKVGTVKIK